MSRIRIKSKISVLFFMFPALLGTLSSPARAVEILCFGDSITAGVNSDSPNNTWGGPDDGYLGHLSKYLNAHWQASTLTNRGRPGDGAAEAAARINSALSGRQYEYVLILIGANDVADIAVEPNLIYAYRGNVEYIVDTCQSKPGLTTILATLLPRYDDPLFAGVVRNMNSQLSSVAKTAGIRLADQYWNFFSRSDLPLFSDPWHPNESGYQAMAEEWASELTGNAVGAIDLISPIFEAISPPPRAEDVSLQPDITITIREVGSALNTDTVVMQINGADVSWNLRQTGGRYVLSYTPEDGFGLGEKVNVSLEAEDTADPGNQSTKQYFFFTAGGNGVNGDINSDGLVDGIDLILLGSAFGSALGEPAFRKRADFDENSIIDGVDLSILSYYFEQ
ncbi:GDSL-type esterase/lipase family protein [Acidobacteriota bacterium]